MKKYLFILLILCFGCETEIKNFKISNPGDNLVVYGELTTANGPYQVQITHVSSYAPYDVRAFVGEPETDAAVSILDNLGNETFLGEYKPGVYSTDMLFKANVGVAYKLKIKTTDGKTFESDFQVLTASPILKDFSETFYNAEKVEDMRFEVKASIQDPADTENYYFVRKQDYIGFLTTCQDPPPPPAVPPPCYIKCWSAPLNTQPILLKDFLVNGNDLPLALEDIKADEITDYVVQLDVLNISKEVFNYWERQEEQRTIGGGLFDKVPAQIIGNLYCTSDPSEQILGVFVVAGITKQRLTIDRFKTYDFETYQKVQNYVDFNNIRRKDLKLNNCWQAGWINYNLGLEIPELKP